MTPKNLIPITKRPDIIFTKGQGSWLFDQQQNRYLDFVQGWAVNCLGHCAPEIVASLNQQAQTLINCSPAYFNEPMIQLANALSSQSCFDEVFFTNSGAEANEGLIKLARKWGQKNKNGAYKIITFENSFHGRTLATMAASGKPGWEDLFPPKVEGFVKVPFNNLEAVKEAIDQKTVAIMLEPILGEAGIYPVLESFIKGLRKLTKKENLLLVFDEIQTGMARTGKLFCYEHYQIEPDLMSLGKSLGGGVPIAAMLSKKEFSCFEPGDQGGTYNGNPLMTQAALAVLNKIATPDFLDEVNNKGAYLTQKLKELSQKYKLGDVRGFGLMLALDLKEKDGTQICQKALTKKLLLNAPRKDTLRLMPALTVSIKEIDLMIETLDEVLGEM